MNAIRQATTSPPTTDHEKLLHAAKQLEGVFFEQLLKAMRETVPHEGMMDGGSGEEMFTSMLDQNVATQAPEQWRHGLSEALYKQLSHLLPSEAPKTR